jgi:hypothetical protein
MTGDQAGTRRNVNGRADMEQLRHHGDPEVALKALSEEAPYIVIPVPRLEQDLKDLLVLTGTIVPHEQAVRSKHLLRVCYGFGDASGEGFGSIILFDGVVAWELVSW